MGVICISSLKGGVGKTTVSVNVSAAFAARDCETLLIDLDPTAHATRYFNLDHDNSAASKAHLQIHGNGTHAHSDGAQSNESGGFNSLANSSLANSLAHCFLGTDFNDFQAAVGPAEGETAFYRQRMENTLARAELLRIIVRPQLSVIPAGPELRHFLWGRGARVFKTLFPMLLKQLRSIYDYIVIDTPPDFNMLTRSAIGQSDLVVVPVDASAMSIHGLEQLVDSAEHIQGPAWSIVRTMVNRQATRSQRCTDERLNRNLFLASGEACEESPEVELDSSNPEQFIAFLAERERLENKAASDAARAVETTNGANNPIFLLNSITYRTEQQNRLTFVGKTCFDSKASSAIAKQYIDMARELEQLIGLSSDVQELPDVNGLDFSYGAKAS